MYRNVIDIHKEVPSDILKVLAMMADRAFDNRAGKVKNVSDCPYRFIYEGGERDYGCLNLGMVSLCEEKAFVSNVLNWNWIDEDEPDESCDVLKEMLIPVR